MRWRTTWRRLPRWLRWTHWEDDLRAELEAHLAHEADDHVARGMTGAAARDAAARKLGNRAHVEEAIYAMNTIRPIDALLKDVTYGARLLRRAPAFTFAAILSLALGIGANTAIFQLLDAVRLRALPIDRPEELVEIRLEGDGGRIGAFTSRNARMTNPLWEQLRDRPEIPQVFSGVLAWGDTSFNLSPSGEARDVPGLWVSGSFFPTLGVRPTLGRLFTPEDDRRGCGVPGAVISHAFWQREFGGRPDVLGRTLTFAAQRVPIVGVTPPSFFGLEVGRTFDVALPLCSQPTISNNRASLDRRDFWWITAMGRLKPGTSLDRANGQLASLSPGMQQATLPPMYQAAGAREYLALVLRGTSGGTGVSGLRNAYERPLALLMAIVGLVLLVACANLANLMLARASAREREISVRIAIGASRGRVVIQLLVEGLMLAILGAAAGLVLARWLSGALVSFLSTPTDRIFLDLSLDWRTLGFTTGVACLTCVLFGLAPALVATRRDVNAAMRAGGRGTTGRDRFMLRRTLVVSQIALSLVLVVGALLFVRSLRNLSTADPGFRSAGVVVANVFMRSAAYPPERRTPFRRTLLDAVRAVPGVTGAAEVFLPPFGGGLWNPRVFGDAAHADGGFIVSFNLVSPGYLQVMGMTLRAGRDLSDRDTPSTPGVAIVNERFAQQVFNGANPLGRRIYRENDAGQPDHVYEIVGLVRDTKVLSLREDPRASVFLAATQDAAPGASVSYVLRGSTDVAAVTADVKRAFARLDPGLGLRFATVQTQIESTLRQERLMATLSGCFGVLAGVLAVIGLYGLVAYMVARRQAEIGVRLALGAQGRDIMRLILGEVLLLIVLGLAVGLPLTLAAGRYAGTLLFGLVPHDATTLAIAAAMLAVAGFLASAWPARRASHTDPVTALRES